MPAMTISVDEMQVIDLIKQLSPHGKKQVFDLLLPDIAPLEGIALRGQKQMRLFATAHGLDWDKLSEEQREQLLDQILHESIAEES